MPAALHEQGCTMKYLSIRAHTREDATRAMTEKKSYNDEFPLTMSNDCKRSHFQYHFVQVNKVEAVKIEDASACSVTMMSAENLFVRDGYLQVCLWPAIQGP